MFSLQFLGAAGSVTGSKFLIESSQAKVMVDCGLFQGLKRLRLRNWEPLPIVPSEIDTILLTHAHIDHSGFIPRLVRLGFQGQIFCTPPTQDLLSIVLPDSAHLQEEEAKFANKKGYSRHKPAMPLYGSFDAQEALSYIVPVDYNEDIELEDKFRFRFHEAGHILGSSMVELTVKECKGKCKLVFTGDLGRQAPALLEDPEIIEETDYLILESTYGNRLHFADDMSQQIIQVVQETALKGGVLLIPCFAVERTQEILFILKTLQENHSIPSLPVYIDSPMANEITKVFNRYEDYLDKELPREPDRKGDLFGYKNFHKAVTVDDSKALNTVNGPMIIIAGSGMATGGRILHHLAQRLPDEKTIVLLVGFQAAGTRGRLMLDGATKVKIHGEKVAVNAKVMYIEGFSSHSDYDDTLNWLSHFSKPPHRTFIVHGEPYSAKALAEKIGTHLGWETYIPAYLDKIYLG